MAAGVNGAGKTTQLQIITGELTPDGGEVVKAKSNMRIAYLTQEFDVRPTRTVRCASSFSGWQSVPGVPSARTLLLLGSSVTSTVLRVASSVHAASRETGVRPRCPAWAARAAHCVECFGTLSPGHCPATALPSR